jgi:hypothetical protein
MDDNFSPPNLIPAKTRTWIYGLCVAAVPALIVWRVIDANDAQIYLTMADALLGGGLATAYRPTR